MMGDPVRCLPKVVHPDVAALKFGEARHRHNGGAQGEVSRLMGGAVKARRPARRGRRTVRRPAGTEAAEVLEVARISLGPCCAAAVPSRGGHRGWRSIAWAGFPPWWRPRGGRPSTFVAHARNVRRRRTADQPTAPHRSGRAGSPHPAPRQMASLRAVAYPLVQEARRWPPPSPRLIWPVRLSGVVTWRRDLGVLAVFPSTGATCRCPLPSTGSRGLNSPASAVL